MPQDNGNRTELIGTENGGPGQGPDNDDSVNEPVMTSGGGTRNHMPNPNNLDGEGSGSPVARGRYYAGGNLSREALSNRNASNVERDPEFLLGRNVDFSRFRE